MKKNFIYFLCLAMLFPSAIQAQRKKKAKKANAVVAEESPRFLSMLSSTAKVCVFDSTVVDSLKYLDTIYANPEEGRLTTHGQFFKDKGESIVYINQMGNKCIYSEFDQEKGYKLLYQCDLLTDGWTTGEPVKGLGEDGGLYDFDYPYLMPDGVTLYFSARGNNGLGGYDIYRTRFDAEEGRFLRPENLGLPFNSENDDYMFVIDEQNQLGYFASNRRQPQGKTCVYSFIPFETRSVVSTSDEQRLRSLAKLERIADTWTSQAERKAALTKKKNIVQRAFAQRTGLDATKLNFVINDHKTYTNLKDFKNKDNLARFKELQALKSQQSTLQETLCKARNYYATASSGERQQLSAEMLQSEQQLQLLRKQIRQLEKQIRNIENQ